jgi:hypothetical protein
LKGASLNIRRGVHIPTNVKTRFDTVGYHCINRYDLLFNGLLSGKDIVSIFRAFVEIANKALAGDYDGTGSPDEREASNALFC